MTGEGNIRYELKTPWRNGTTHVVFEPLDFMAKLAALVPMPGINLTRFHGVFAPRHSCRARIVRQNGRKQGNEGDVKTEGKRRAGMRWAQRLKRVFDIDITVCEACSGAVKIIASIEDPAVIRQILSHLQTDGSVLDESLLPPNRAPPAA